MAAGTPTMEQMAVALERVHAQNQQLAGVLQQQQQQQHQQAQEQFLTQQQVSSFFAPRAGRPRSLK